MDFELSEEQRAIAATVRDFVRRELVPHEDLVERLDAVPEELAREIRGKAIAAGLYAANFPAELGGGGLDAMGVTLAERELGWTSWALQTLVSRPSNILQACRDGQVETYLLPTIRGERHRLPGHDRARRRLGRPVDDDQSPPGRRRLGHQRRQALHQLCRHGRLRRAVRRDRDRAGPAGRALGDIGLPGGPRHPRVHGQPRHVVGLPPRLPPLRAGVRRLPGSRAPPCSATRAMGSTC